MIDHPSEPAARRAARLAFGASTDWIHLLIVLSKLRRVPISQPPSNRRLSYLTLGSPDGGVIDAFNRFRTAGHKPNLAQQMIVHLMRPLRSQLVLSTSWDDLQIQAFEEIGEPLQVFDVHKTGGLPDPNLITGTDSIIRLHGGLFETRADSTLLQEPSPQDIEHFKQYLFGKNQILNEGSKPHPCRSLLIVGYQGLDNRVMHLLTRTLAEISKARREINETVGANKNLSSKICLIHNEATAIAVWQQIRQNGSLPDPEFVTLAQTLHDSLASCFGDQANHGFTKQKLGRLPADCVPELLSAREGDQDFGEAYQWCQPALNDVRAEIDMESTAHPERRFLVAMQLLKDTLPRELDGSIRPGRAKRCLALTMVLAEFLDDAVTYSDEALTTHAKQFEGNTTRQADLQQLLTRIRALPKEIRNLINDIIGRAITQPREAYNEILKFLSDKKLLHKWQIATSRIYWICDLRTNPDHLWRQFAPLLAGGNQDLLLMSQPKRLDLLLYELYQDLTCSLPPGGLQYPFIFKVPPEPSEPVEKQPQVYSAFQRELLSFLDHSYSETMDGKSPAKRTRDSVDQVGETEAKQSRLKDLFLSSYFRIQIVLRQREDNSAGESPQPHSSQSGRLIICYGGRGISSAISDLFWEIQVGPDRRECVWLELADYGSPLAMWHHLMATVAQRQGILRQEHIRLSRDIDEVQRSEDKQGDSFANGLLDPEERRQLHQYLRVDQSKWTIFLYGRSIPGFNAGWESEADLSFPGAWNEADYKVFHKILEELVQLGFFVIYLPTPARNKREIPAKLCSLANDQEKDSVAARLEWDVVLAQRIRARDQDTLPAEILEYLAPCLKSPDLLYDPGEPREIGWRSLNPSSSRKVLGDLDAFINQTPRSTAPGDLPEELKQGFDDSNTPAAKRRFIHTLCLIRHSRHWSALLSEAAIRCIRPFSIEPGEDNDRIRAILAETWLRELERIGFIRKKFGGFAWIHWEYRLRVRLHLEREHRLSPPYTAEHGSNEQNANAPLPSPGRTVVARTSTSHHWVAVWYFKAFQASKHPQPLLECLYHHLCTLRRALEGRPSYANKEEISPKSRKAACRIYRQQIATLALSSIARTLRFSRPAIRFWFEGKDDVGTFKSLLKEINKSCEKLSRTFTPDDVVDATAVKTKFTPSSKRKRRKAHEDRLFELYERLPTDLDDDQRLALALTTLLENSDLFKDKPGASPKRPTKNKPTPSRSSDSEDSPKLSDARGNIEQHYKSGLAATNDAHGAIELARRAVEDEVETIIRDIRDQSGLSAIHNHDPNVFNQARLVDDQLPAQSASYDPGEGGDAHAIRSFGHGMNLDLRALWRSLYRVSDNDHLKGMHDQDRRAKTTAKFLFAKETDLLAEPTLWTTPHEFLNLPPRTWRHWVEYWLCRPSDLNTSSKKPTAASSAPKFRHPAEVEHAIQLLAGLAHAYFKRTHLWRDFSDIVGPEDRKEIPNLPQDFETIARRHWANVGAVCSAIIRLGRYLVGYQADLSARENIGIRAIYGVSLAYLQRFTEAHRRLDEATAFLANSRYSLEASEWGIIHLRRAEIYFLQALSELQGELGFTHEYPSEFFKRPRAIATLVQAWTSLSKTENKLAGDNRSNWWWGRLTVLQLRVIKHQIQVSHWSDSLGDPNDLINHLLRRGLLLRDDRLRNCRLADAITGYGEKKPRIDGDLIKLLKRKLQPRKAAENDTKDEDFDSQLLRALERTTLEKLNAAFPEGEESEAHEPHNR